MPPEIKDRIHAFFFAYKNNVPHNGLIDIEDIKHVAWVRVITKVFEN